MISSGVPFCVNGWNSFSISQVAFACPQKWNVGNFPQSNLAHFILSNKNVFIIYIYLQVKNLTVKDLCFKDYTLRFSEKKVIMVDFLQFLLHYFALSFNCYGDFKSKFSVISNTFKYNFTWINKMYHSFYSRFFFHFKWGFVFAFVKDDFIFCIICGIAMLWVYFCN